jgi:branched-chain amino acid transport system substrate-binding protein
MLSRRNFLRSTAASASYLVCSATSRAETPGVTDNEIKIGQTMPYSGPASAYAVIGQTEAAYFKMINDQGGVNGRKINLISVDDAYSPPKTVELIRKLVEQDHVAFFFNTLGTGPNLAVRDYLNENKIPQLFLATGASKFGDYEHYPWTMGYNPSYQTEARIYGKHILATKPSAKIGVLYQNDDFGKDYLIGLKDVLGDKYASMVIKEASYETSEPTVDSQIISLQNSAADTFVIAATPKFAAQALRKTYDVGWKPVEYLTNVSVTIATVLKPAGVEKCVGAITGAYMKEPTDPRWKDDAGLQAWREFMNKYMPGANETDISIVYGYGAAMTMVQVLKQCGNDLSRERIMREAANLKDFALPILLPGMTLNTSPTNYNPIRQMQLARFTGMTWELIGEVVSG